MITTRRATTEDIDAFNNVIIESVLALCRDHYTPRELKSLLAQYPGRPVYEKWLHERVLVVAEDEGKIIGFAQYFPPNSTIEAVHVLPSHVKRGIGKKLLNLIEDIAREQGAERITLGSSLNAVGFYSKCGYVKQGTGTLKCNDGVELEVVNFEKAMSS